MNIERVSALAGAASAILLIMATVLVGNVIETTVSRYPETSSATAIGTVYAYLPSNPSEASGNSTGPCGLFPGVSTISFSNGSQACVAGPPVIVGYDGVADFRNGTEVSLGFTGWYNSLIAGTPYLTVVLENGTRILFDSSGVEGVTYPDLGKEVFANGTVVTFSACNVPIDAGPPNYPYGVSANGTVWYTLENETVVYLYPDGTCGSLTTPLGP